MCKCRLYNIIRNIYICTIYIIMQRRRRRSETSPDTSLGLHEFHRSVTRRLVVHERGEATVVVVWRGGKEIRGALVLMTAAVIARAREGVGDAPRRFLTLPPYSDGIFSSCYYYIYGFFFYAMALEYSVLRTATAALVSTTTAAAGLSI